MCAQNAKMADEIFGVREPDQPAGIEIRRAVAMDIPGIREVVDARLGTGYLDSTVLEGPDTEDFCAFDGPQLVGFCFGRIWEVDAFLRAFPKVNGNMLVGLGSSIAHIESIAMDHAYGGRGIAARLAWECFTALLRRSIRHFVVTAWTSRRGGTHVARLLERGRFEMVDQIDGYWAGFMECPECRPNDCTCRCTVYMRDLPEAALAATS